MAEAPHMQEVLLPSVVCAAFALELYFKCLRIMDKGAYSDEHNLRALFDQLGAPTQQRIRELFVPYLLAAQKADDGISDASVPLDDGRRTMVTTKVLSTGVLAILVEEVNGRRL
jgi:hypothetical protein